MADKSSETKKKPEDRTVWIEYRAGDPLPSGYGGNGYQFRKGGDTCVMTPTEAKRICDAFPKNFKQCDPPKGTARPQTSDAAKKLPALKETLNKLLTEKDVSEQLAGIANEVLGKKPESQDKEQELIGELEFVISLITKLPKKKDK